MTVGNQGSRQVRGGSDLFPTTLWGDIRDAQGRSTPALARLCERYRQPLFVYLQRRGLDYHTASDLVQGFFAHLLEREFLVGLDPDKGRFRAFLLQSLQNYLADKWDEARAWKRGGRVQHVHQTNAGTGRVDRRRVAAPGPDFTGRVGVCGPGFSWVRRSPEAAAPEGISLEHPTRVGIRVFASRPVPE